MTGKVNQNNRPPRLFINAPAAAKFGFSRDDIEDVVTDEKNKFIKNYGGK